MRRVACKRALYHRAIAEVTTTMRRRQKRPSKISTFGGWVVRQVLIGRTDAPKCVTQRQLPLDSFGNPAKALALSNCIYALSRPFLTDLEKTFFMQTGR